MVNKQLQEVLNVIEELSNRVSKDEIQYCHYVLSEELMFKDCEGYTDEERELLGNILHNSNELLRLVGTMNRLKENLKNFQNIS